MNSSSKKRRKIHLLGDEDESEDDSRQFSARKSKKKTKQNSRSKGKHVDTDDSDGMKIHVPETDDYEDGNKEKRTEKKIKKERKKEKENRKTRKLQVAFNPDLLHNSDASQNEYEQMQGTSEYGTSRTVSSKEDYLRQIGAYNTSYFNSLTKNNNIEERGKEDVINDLSKDIANVNTTVEIPEEEEMNDYKKNIDSGLENTISNADNISLDDDIDRMDLEETEDGYNGDLDKKSKESCSYNNLLAELNETENELQVENLSLESEIIDLENEAKEKVAQLDILKSNYTEKFARVDYMKKMVMYLSNLTGCLRSKIPMIEEIKSLSNSSKKKFIENRFFNRRKEIDSCYIENKDYLVVNDYQSFAFDRRVESVQSLNNKIRQQDYIGQYYTDEDAIDIINQSMNKSVFESSLSDDETSEDDTYKKRYNEQKNILNEAKEYIFYDTHEDYFKPENILSTFKEWKLHYQKEYKAIYCNLVLPSLLTPTIDMDIFDWDPLEMLENGKLYSKKRELFRDMEGREINFSIYLKLINPLDCLEESLSYANEHCGIQISSRKWFALIQNFTAEESANSTSMSIAEQTDFIDDDTFFLGTIMEKSVFPYLGNVIENIYDPFSAEHNFILVHLINHIFVITLETCPHLSVEDLWKMIKGDVNSERDITNSVKGQKNALHNNLVLQRIKSYIANYLFLPHYNFDIQLKYKKSALEFCGKQLLKAMKVIFNITFWGKYQLDALEKPIISSFDLIDLVQNDILKPKVVPLLTSLVNGVDQLIISDTCNDNNIQLNAFSRVIFHALSISFIALLFLGELLKSNSWILDLDMNSCNQSPTNLQDEILTLWKLFSTLLERIIDLYSAEKERKKFVSIYENYLDSINDLIETYNPSDGKL